MSSVWVCIYPDIFGIFGDKKENAITHNLCDSRFPLGILIFLPRCLFSHFSRISAVFPVIADWNRDYGIEKGKVKCSFCDEDQLMKLKQFDLSIWWLYDLIHVLWTARLYGRDKNQELKNENLFQSDSNLFNAQLRCPFIKGLNKSDLLVETENFVELNVFGQMQMINCYQLLHKSQPH